MFEYGQSNIDKHNAQAVVIDFRVKTTREKAADYQDVNGRLREESIVTE